VQMLVARRVSVTLAAGALPNAGLMRYRRAEVVTVDRADLEGASWGHDRVLRDEFDRLLEPAAGPKARPPLSC
jgi:hypothetical protein